MINKKIQTKAQQTKVINELVDDLRKRLDVYNTYMVNKVEDCVEITSVCIWGNLITDIAFMTIYEIYKMYEMIYSSTHLYITTKEDDGIIKPCVTIRIDRR